MIATAIHQRRLSSIEQGFDRRIVRYEEVHGIQQSDFDLLCSAVLLNKGDMVLDLGCGYGAVTRELHSRNRKADVSYVLLDSSLVQLERARRELAGVFGPRFLEQHASLVHARFPEHPFKVATFDRIVAKMFLHELPKPDQLHALLSMRHLLKQKGELILWELALDPTYADLVRSIIRRKDELCGFVELARDRHLPTGPELLGLLSSARFNDLQIVGEIPYSFDTAKRLKPEFQSDQAKYQQWLGYIRAEALTTTPEILAQLKFLDHGDRITLTFPKFIIRSTGRHC